MKRFFTIIILCTLIYACKPGIPKNIIQPMEMEKVLVDIHIVDGYISTLSLPSQDTAKTVAAPLYKGIYKKFGIDSALYYQSLNYYYKHPALLKKMYDSIAVKINILKDMASKELAEPEFRSIFDINLKDSSQIDQTLNHKYNYRYLIKDRYGNFGIQPKNYVPGATIDPGINLNAPQPVKSIDQGIPKPVE
jgi:hypothetical protein